MRAAAVVIALMLAGAAPPPPSSAPPGVEIRDDGSIVHRPSGLRLPREIRGSDHTHNATLHLIGPEGVSLDYGPVTVRIGAPTPAADPVMVPPGFAADTDPPSLPALLFWGESAQPLTVSFRHAEGGDGKDWLSFSIVAEGWQIELSSHYPPAARDTVLRTAEAVWAMLASANETVRR